MIAGDSIKAIVATIQPLNGTARCVRSEVAAINVTALTEPYVAATGRRIRDSEPAAHRKENPQRHRQCDQQPHGERDQHRAIEPALVQFDTTL
jgi:hypothetical protein